MKRNVNVVIESALTYTKTRNMYGLVIIFCNTKTKQARVKYAKEWPRERQDEIPFDIYSMYKKLDWDGLHIDQITGQHLIESIKRIEVPVKTLTTQKDLKDPKGIEYLEVMDKNEMVSLFMKFREKKQIEFPKKPSRALEILEEQMPLYLEHITEAGSVDYYAPGDEHDHLAKALLMCCFVVRDILEDGGNYGVTFIGAMKGKKRLRNRPGSRSDFYSDASVIAGLSGPAGRHIHYY